MKVNFQRAFEDGQRWAATDRVGQTVPGARCCDGEGAVLRPLLYVPSPARWDRPMTRSAGDAVIPHSRPGRWRSAGSSVRTRVRTGRPVCTLLDRQLPRSPSRIIMPRQYWRKLFVDFSLEISQSARNPMNSSAPIGTHYLCARAVFTDCEHG